MNMSKLQKINRTSNITTYRAIKNQKVQDVLHKLNLELKFFAVLVNGKRVGINQEIQKDDEIVILPKIAGG